MIVFVQIFYASCFRLSPVVQHGIDTLTLQIMLALGGSKTTVSEDGVAVDVDSEVRFHEPLLVNSADSHNNHAFICI